jgi:hypothetical protein
MNTEALFIFLILLLGLVLCSFLGGNCTTEGFDNQMETGVSGAGVGLNPKTMTPPDQDSGYDNYNHYSGSSTQVTNGTVFYGQNGGSISVVSNSDGTQSLQLSNDNNSQPIVFTTTPSSNETSSENRSVNTFYGPNGSSASIFTSNDGQHAISVTTKKGTTVYTQSGSISNANTYPPNTPNTYPPNTYPPTYPPTSYPPTSYPPPNQNANNYDNKYSNYLPTGIPASQIPVGQEDLYILKSEVVPPVCPACPTSTACPRQEPCPACPPCGRCPEPAFDCKKVPNYNSINNSYLPVPVLNNFASFGM